MNIMKNQHNFHSGERLNIREFCFRAALLFMPPVTAFYLMQFIYGAWPWQTGLQAAAAIILAPFLFGMGVITKNACAAQN